MIPYFSNKFHGHRVFQLGMRVMVGLMIIQNQLKGVVGNMLMVICCQQNKWVSGSSVEARDGIVVQMNNILLSQPFLSVNIQILMMLDLT